MLKAIIIDDDARDQELLEMLLNKYCSDDIQITGTADTVDKGCLLILETKPDLLFLDVELGEETGFDVLTRLKEIPFKVIFVTAHDRYAIQAIKFNALDYILKPVEIPELVKAVKKTRETLSITGELQNLLHNLAHPHQKSNRIAVPLLNGYRMISVQDIIFCKAEKEYTYIYATGQAPICSSTNLGEYEDLLRDYSFCRVHHSFLVNKDHVKLYVKGEGGEITTSNDTVIPVSRRKKPEVVEWLTTNK